MPPLKRKLWIAAAISAVLASTTGIAVAAGSSDAHSAPPVATTTSALVTITSTTIPVPPPTTIPPPTTSAPVPTTAAPVTTAPRPPVTAPRAPGRPSPAPRPAQAPTGSPAALVARYPWPVATALRVMACESGGRPGARNAHSSATGLFQILGGPLDPERNVALAYQMWRERGWQPWDASAACWRR